MCDQTKPYTPGTWVWVKLFNRIWWPGKTVELSSIPDHLESYKKKRKNPIAAVYFERDKSYEIIINLDKVFLYSCDKKMEFVEKGYLIYVKQRKGGFVLGNFEMQNFIDDVIAAENETGGDPCIFDVFIKKNETEEKKKISQVNVIKELFITEKERKKREKERQSLPSFKVPSKNSKGTNKNPSPLQKPRQSLGKMPIVPHGYNCPYCDEFQTNRYSNLKWHMNAHKNENKNNKIEETKIQKKSPTTKKSPKSSKSASSGSTSDQKVSTRKKRQYTKTKKTEAKKIKLQDELLKDWDDGDDGEDLDESVTQLDETQDKDTDLDTTQKNDSTGVENLDQNKETDQNKDSKIDVQTSETTVKNVESTPSRIFDFVENEDDEMYLSSEKIDSVHESNNSAIKKELPISTIDDVQIETANNVTDSSKIESDLPETIKVEDKIEDKVGAVFDRNVENFLSALPEPEWVKTSWKNMNPNDENDEELYCVDFTKRLQIEEYPRSISLKNDDNRPQVTFFTEIVPSTSPDIDEMPKHVGTVTCYLPNIPPKHTTEEILASEAYREIMEMVNAGGELRFSIDCPVFYEIVNKE